IEHDGVSYSMRRVVVLAASCCACGRLGFDSIESIDPTGDAGAASYATAVNADHPIAYFQFDETGGTVAHGGAFDGQYEGTFGFGVTGAMPGSRAVRFDGQTTRIPLGDVFRFPGTASYSFELWLRPTG